MLKILLKLYFEFISLPPTTGLSFLFYFVAKTFYPSSVSLFFVNIQHDPGGLHVNPIFFLSLCVDSDIFLRLRVISSQVIFFIFLYKLLNTLEVFSSPSLMFIAATLELQFILSIKICLQLDK